METSTIKRKQMKKKKKRFLDFYNREMMSRFKDRSQPLVSSSLFDINLMAKNTKLYHNNSQPTISLSRHHHE